INNQNFVRGSAIYFRWTRDINFLRENIQRMRLAIHYLMTEMKATEENCIVTPFVGHCGRSGIELRKDGKKVIHYGRGIGNNYWDLLPMGHKDAYATIHYYDTLNQMIELERDIAGHPEWDIPGGPLRFDPDELAEHARKVKEVSGRLFWNPETKRFVSGLDIDGNGHDYGFTFLNLEAIYYDFATPRQAEDILSWIAGDRLVAGDTSQGADIYRWRFGPRSTTKRNIEYYGWFWSGPESIPWGGQVQDGGAVLGFSYHDMMARLKVRGPDDAWRRLLEVVHWFDDVQKAGGYRAYYKDGKPGTTLHGGGTAGGLGVDHEFFESILVPQVMIDGFLGFRPTGEGFALSPRLPHDCPELRVDQIHLHDVILDIRVTPSTIEITKKGPLDEPLRVRLPSGAWTCQHRNESDKIISEEKISSEKTPAIVTWLDADGLRLMKD
ncbi:MAG: glycosyl hydrolase family 65 protein, partial [Phycisphaerae bacterium]